MKIIRLSFIIGALIASSVISHDSCGSLCSSYRMVNPAHDSAIEDLLWGHVVTHRILIAYDAIARRLERNKSVSHHVFSDIISITKDFVQDYLEKVQENNIFSLFAGQKKYERIIAMLKEQHRMGRLLIDAIAHRTKKHGIKGMDSKHVITNLIRKFVRMYRVHLCKEDSILYPELCTLSEEQYQDLTNNIHAMFDERLGSAKFQDIHKKLDAIEKQLDIEDFGVLTPRISRRGSLVEII